MSIPAGTSTAAQGNLVLRAAQTRFGVLTIHTGQIWTAQSPMLGFDDLRQFLVLAVDQQRPFVWLQSLEDAQVSFLLAPAACFGLDYGPPPPTGLSGAQDWVMVLLPTEAGQALRPHRLAPLQLHPASATFVQRVVEADSVKGEGALLPDVNPAPTAAMLQRMVALQARPQEA